MKTITKIFLTLTMLLALSFVQGQTFDVEGYIISSPQQSHEVIISYYDTNSNVVTTDVLYTDIVTGFYTATYNSLSVPGMITMVYTDCNGNEITLADFAFNATIDFGIIDFCAPISTSYDAFVNVQILDFDAVNGLVTPMNFELSWDDGITFVSHVTDSTGAYYETLTNAPSSGNVIIRYTDCNGVVIENNQLFNQMNSDVFFMEFYCDGFPNPNAGNTTIMVNNTNGMPVSINISIDGGLTFSTVTTDSFGLYTDTIIATSLIATYTNCFGATVTDSAELFSFVGILFLELDYCPVVCQAGFFLDQEIVFDTTTFNILFTGNMMIMNSSIGTNLTYTWDFGDGSPSYTGVNFTHAYTTAGSYNLCLSIDNGTGCTDYFCETLVIDSNGILSGKTNTAFVLQMGDGEVETEVVSGINELEKNVKVNIYPNPASNFINVSLNSKINENATLSIYDLTGKLVQFNEVDLIKGNQNIKIELNDLNKGMYITQLKTVNGTLSSKLSIK